MHSPFLQGNIENRMHMNSLDTDSFFFWTEINGKLVEYAKLAKAKDIAKNWTREEFLGLFSQKAKSHIDRRWEEVRMRGRKGENADLTRYLPRFGGP